MAYAMANAMTNVRFKTWAVSLLVIFSLIHVKLFTSARKKTPAAVPLHRYPGDTALLELAYARMCNSSSAELASVNFTSALAKIHEHDEFTAVEFGKQSWNRLALDELRNSTSYFDNNDVSAVKFPFTVLSYGSRLKEGQRMMDAIGIERHQRMEVSYPSLELAFEMRADFIAEKLFTQASAVTSYEQWTKKFAGVHKGRLLGTLNQWIVMQLLSTRILPETVLVLEDDIVPVPNFTQKLKQIMLQLASPSIPAWDIVFLGTCFEIKSDVKVMQNLYRANDTRCFNAVLYTRRCAQKVLEHGAIVDEFTSVDFLFNQYIPQLGLDTFFAYPPLAYEGSKNPPLLPCPSTNHNEC